MRAAADSTRLLKNSLSYELRKAISNPKPRKSAGTLTADEGRLEGKATFDDAVSSVMVAARVAAQRLSVENKKKRMFTLLEFNNLLLFYVKGELICQILVGTLCAATLTKFRN